MAAYWQWHAVFRDSYLRFQICSSVDVMEWRRRNLSPSTQSFDVIRYWNESFIHSLLICLPNQNILDGVDDVVGILCCANGTLICQKRHKKINHDNDPNQCTINLSNLPIAPFKTLQKWMFRQVTDTTLCHHRHSFIHQTVATMYSKDMACQRCWPTMMRWIYQKHHIHNCPLPLQTNNWMCLYAVWLMLLNWIYTWWSEPSFVDVRQVSIVVHRPM